MSNASGNDVSGKSPSEDWTTVAVLGRPRGNKGELLATALSSRPERFASLTSVYLFGGESSRQSGSFEIERVWIHDGVPVFKFKGVDSIQAAETLRGAEVRVPVSERVSLEPDEYFQSDLTGCEVRDRVSGRLIGRVTGWQEYGGPALLEIDDGRMLIPFVKAICTGIHPEQRLILTDLPDGLEDL